jgi:hypothetical protein
MKRWAGAVVSAGLLGLGACGDGGERARPSGSALWLDAAAQRLTVAEASRLESAGIGELFAEAATVDWEGERPVVRPLPPPPVPGRARTMLVARGRWPVAELSDPAAAGSALAEGVAAILRGLEESGWAVAGWHLDLDGGPQPELLDGVREALEPRLLLSVTVPRELLGDPEREKLAEDLVEPADFVVSFLYGTRAGEGESDTHWDFRSVERNVRALDQLERPYLVGVVTRATVQHLRDGVVAGDLPGVSLGELAWNQSLRLRPGFLLEGIDRQVYEFIARSATRVGSVRLATGDAVRVVGTSTAHVQELRRLLGTWELQHRLGELYDRLPAPGDTLSLAPENLIRVAAAAGKPAPQPRVTVLTLSRAPRRTMIRIVLENASREPSELAQVESNYVELRVVGGGFGRVDPGGFYRYDSFVADPSGRLQRSIRNPPILRLFAPYLGPEERLESGPIEVRSARDPEDVIVRATFLAPLGGDVELPPVSWLALAPRPTPTPTPSPAASRRR